MTTLNLQINAGANDATEDFDGTDFTSSGNYLYCVSNTSGSQYRDIFGTRFTGATVPQGATVSVATFQGYVALNSFHVYFHCEDEDSPNDFVTEADVLSRTRTTASTLYSATGVGFTWQSVTVTSAAQEVVDRGGFDEATICVLAYGSAAINRNGGFLSYDWDSAKAAKLDITYLAPSAAITGTVGNGAFENEIVSTGGTVIITLTDDTWVAAGATFDAQRQNIIDGLDSAQSEAGGWNAKVRDVIGVGTVVRTSDTVCTITIPATGDYAISANETITVTVPASALVTSSSPVVAAPTFVILNGGQPVHAPHPPAIFYPDTMIQPAGCCDSLNGALIGHLATLGVGR